MTIENLSSIPIFIDLDEQEFAEISESCTPRKYPKNSMIIAISIAPAISNMPVTRVHRRQI